MDKQTEYGMLSKFSLIKELQARGCALKYPFERRKRDLIMLLERIDAGESPMRIAQEELEAMRRYKNHGEFLKRDW